MDPNETLRLLREAVLNLDATMIRPGSTSHEIAADAVAAHFKDLDEWLCKGGFLPTDWQNDNTQPKGVSQ